MSYIFEWLIAMAVICLFLFLSGTLYKLIFL